ncbi:multiheme c-type cytochrome [Tundrisphaera sp. TA3]|uniref:multiheme c-type cytochrome n=1 Tax=Tundrisphaera sp. TA3 TaxID=3435775 RepID=UPI003EBBAD9D
MGVKISRTGLMLAAASLILGSATPGRSDLPPDRPVWVGTGSCAALACHGQRSDPARAGGAEYAYWASYDPHNKAFSVLFDDRSRQIEANYRRLVDVDNARAFADDLCLRCHVHQGYDSRDPSAHAPGFASDDGAGCESCHGPAGKWLAPHTEAGWRSLSVAQKEADFGFRTTKDLLVRARICAECHVGDGSAEVNHDLIAAGHPRLNFDYAGQLAKLPKHWRVGDDKARHPDYEAKAWALGRLAGARAALDLLESRARRAAPDDSRAPWPEFSEYGCFSCHQGLDRTGGRSTVKSPGLIPGSLPWGSWTLASAPIPGPSPGRLAIGEPESPLGLLRGVMVEADPDPATVARRARAAADELGRRAELLNRSPLSLAEIRASLADVIAEAPTSLRSDWDTAAQSYLAIVALRASLMEFDARYADPRIRSGLAGMYQELNLPARDGGALFDSPVAFDPARIQGDLINVRDALPPHP